MQVDTWTRIDEDSVTRIVLTIAHMDHTLEKCAQENLKAFCQRCHLRYDHPLHQRNSAMTRRRGKASADLFDKEDV